MSQEPPISRYRTSAGVEGQFEPGSRKAVLRNKRGIRSKRAMDRAEFEALLAAQEAYLSIITVRTVFTTELICRMHRDWLGGIYEWAGRYRGVEMSKGGFFWPPARLVAQNMEGIERETLRKLTPCRPAAMPQVAAAMAQVQADLLMVHPFREGNGRLALGVRSDGHAGWPAGAGLCSGWSGSGHPQASVSARRHFGLPKRLCAFGGPLGRGPGAGLGAGRSVMNRLAHEPASALEDAGLQRAAVQHSAPGGCGSEIAVGLQKRRHSDGDYTRQR